MAQVTVDAQAAPELSIPDSSKTIRVRAIDTTTRMSCDAFAFVEPPIKHHEKLNFPTMCFLLEHDTDSGTDYVLYDCGSRKDFWNGSPKSQSMIGGHVPSVQVDAGVDEVLVAAGFELDNLDAIVWSHWHWDHIGDGSKFPPSTDIVVGPGFKDNFIPGWPINPEGFVLQSDLEGHRVVEPEFNLTVAGFAAHDYFGDGSLYLLDVPGHAVGHMCAMARTTPDTFVFLGGDCCHYAGAFRPTPFLPLPVEIPSDQLDPWYTRPCPCSVFTQHHPVSKSNTSSATQDQSRTQPFYKVSTQQGSAYTFGEAAQRSIDKLQILDASPNVFICLAHDDILFRLLPLFNNDKDSNVNDWKSRGYKLDSRWGFLNELPKGDKPGRPPLVTGKWRNGKQIKWDAERGFLDV